MNTSVFREIALFAPHSNTSCEANKTGSWRFLHPRFDEKTAPCSAACPLGQDIPRIEMLISRGLLKEAWRHIISENPLPATCGRVCFHPCEKACNRINLDEPVAIHHLERFLGDSFLSGSTPANRDPQPAKGARVAIAGAGPAGLAAAFFLTRLGYSCDVFEASSEAGGLLRRGIPAYRLPHHILEMEISRIVESGVAIHCKTPVTAGLLEKIFREYNALFVGCGHARSINLRIQGGDHVQDGLDFLRRMGPRPEMSLQGTAAIVGGGNTAVDLARSLVRLGAAPLIVYRRRVEDMPAFEPEVATALKEGVEIMELVAPVRVQKNPPGAFSNNSGGYRLTLQCMQADQKGTDGRTNVRPDGEKTVELDVHGIFAAVGATADSIWRSAGLEDTPTLSLSHCRLIEQKIPIIFGGDLASPIKSVTDAIASGKQAALALDTYFTSGLNAVEKHLAACRVGAGPALSMHAYEAGDRYQRNDHVVGYTEIGCDYFAPLARMIPPFLDADSDIRSFDEISATCETDDALREAARCFNCGTCNACGFCRLYCPEMAVVVDDARRRIDLDYCKGCGVCVTECPRNAMVLEEETK